MSIRNSPHNSQPARLPAITVPSTVDPALRMALEAIKERLEVREGSRGNPYERSVTVRDLLDAGLDVVVNGQRLYPSPKGIAQNAKAITLDDNDPTVTGLRKLVSVETAKLLAEIRRVERLTTSIKQGIASGGLDLTQAIAASGVNRYTRTDLENDLATGAAKIIAGATSGNAVMEVAENGSYVLFKHRLANIAGLGSGYTGDWRTGLGITAAGLIAGYNRKSDGAWQNSIVIDSATGDVTILGTLKAGAVIETGVTVSGTSMGDIRTGSLNGTSALSSLGTKLNKSAADILSGVISVTTGGGFVAGNLVWDGSGNRTSGTGIAMTPQGILGHNGTKVTFSINATTGNAVFGGSLDAASGTFAGSLSAATGTFTGSLSAATGTFSGTISTTGYVIAEGNITDAGTQAALIGKNTNHGGWAVGALTTSPSGLGGLYASSPGGYGTYGSGFIGAFGIGTGSTGIGVQGQGGFSGAGVECIGRFRWGAYTYTAPGGSTTLFMRADGTWATPTMSVAWNDVTGKPATFPPAVHNHLFQDIVAGGGNLSCQFSDNGGATWNNILLRKV